MCRNIHIGVLWLQQYHYQLVFTTSFVYFSIYHHLTPWRPYTHFFSGISLVYRWYIAYSSSDSDSDSS